jgi:sugar phosphate isomerase/epimerase
MAATAAGVYATKALMACSSMGGRKLGNIGYITGILGRDLRERDWRSILTQTAEFGYTEIETGGYLGDSYRSFLDFCSSVGLKPIAGGTQFTNDMDELKRSLDNLNALEMQYAVLYWPWNSGGPFTLKDCKESAEMLNRIGEVTKATGLTLCWHNHDREFWAMEEGLPFDYLMDNTDVSLVKCQLDIYWTQKGGADPVETLKKYPGRYPMLHVKDMASGEMQDFACPGSGIIDWVDVFNESLDQGIKHYIVERDNEPDGLGCLKGSAEYLLNLRM